MIKTAEQQPFIRVLLLVITLAAVGQMTNTIYVPAMHMMAQYFHVDDTKIQTVMGMYLLPYGLSQFIYGPLSDRFGRRPIILTGLCIFIVGSLIAAIAPTFSALILGSFIQGMGIGVGGVMARTVMRDLYSGRELHRATSYVSVVLIVAPLFAPLLGGILSYFWSWRANFIFLILFALLVLAIEHRFFKETNQFAGSTSLSLNKLKQNYFTIFSNLQFLAYLSCLIVTFSGVCVFEAVGGILFNHVLHYSTIATSLWFILPLPFYMLGSYMSGVCSRSWQLNNTLLFGIILLLLGALSMLLTGLFGWINITAMLIPISIYMFAAGILFPAATSGALQPFPRLAGTAGAILGGMQNLGAGLAIFVSATIRQTSQLPLGCVLSVMSIAVAIIFYFCLWQQPTEQ